MSLNSIMPKYDAKGKPLKEIKDTQHDAFTPGIMNDAGDFFQALADIGLGFELGGLKAKAINKCRECHGVLDDGTAPDLCNKCYNTGIIGLGAGDKKNSPRQFDVSTPIWE